MKGVSLLVLFVVVGVSSTHDSVSVPWKRPLRCYETFHYGFNCLAYMLRYKWNAVTEKCEQFVYGGCGGNNNNFKTMEECLNVCEDIDPENTSVDLSDILRQLVPQAPSS